MKLHRFFINPNSIQGESIFLDDPETIDQIKKVLRLKTGDEVLFLDGSGKEYRTAIKEIGNSVIKGEVIESLQNQNEPELKITLYQALCKKDKFEWILQKGTEVGISEFVPVITERTEKLGLNRERADKILKEAAEQSERGIIPKLLETQNFEDMIKNAVWEKIILDKSGEKISSRLSSVVGRKSNVNLFVGPEGGWTEQELKISKESGAKIISLGPRVLRAETAGIIAAAILLNS